MEKENPFDAPDLVKARASQADPWVLYLVVRETLRMSAGKVAAQAGHAVGMVYEEYIRQTKEEKYFLNKLKEKATLTDQESAKWDNLKSSLNAFRSWRSESFRKVTLRADDKEWAKLKEQLECFVVRDAGLTEIEAGSETVIALWPNKKSLVPKTVKRLQVYA